MSRLSEDFLRGIVESEDIVDVVSRYVSLKKAGKDFTARCPFHSEKSPSFTVSRLKQFYHCFGCGAHGDVIGFLTAYTGSSFIETVEKLAAGQGKSLPTDLQSDVHQLAKVKRIEQTLLAAKVRYSNNLASNQIAMAYLEERGVTIQSIQQFGLGFANGNDLRHIQPSEVDIHVEAGLIGRNESGKLFERFVNRLIFPIAAESGKVIGFGGRVISAAGKQAKYINSPESTVFDKGNELFGLNIARSHIHRSNTAIVVEGYMDVLMLHQFGENRCVAPLGTALSERQLRRLFRLCDNIVICFDADKAGGAATERAAWLALGLLTDGKSVKLLTLDDGHDPDTYIRAYGIECWNASLASQATALSTYLINQVASETDGTAEGRVKSVQRAMAVLQEIKHAPLFRHALKQAFELALGSSLTALPDVVEKPTVKEKYESNSSRLAFYQNFALLCALDIGLLDQIPDSAMDTTAALISSWFAIAPKDCEDRLHALSKLDRSIWADIATQSVQKAAHWCSHIPLERRDDEIEAVLKTVLRVSSAEEKRKATLKLFR